MSSPFARNQVVATTPGATTQVFSYPQRILWVDAAADLLVLIAIEPDLRQPKIHSHSEAAELLTAAQIAIVEVRPRPFVLEQGHAIPDRYLRMRNTSWKIVEPLIGNASLPAIFDEATRATLIGARAAQLGIAPRKIRRILYRYWAHGSTANALIPFYDRCGPQGTREERRQKPGASKRGPKPDRVRMTEDPALTGPALGDIRERMVAGVTEFYRIGVTRARAWRQTKGKYFSTGFVQHGGRAIPIEPLAHEAPSYKQFYNLIAELDTSLDITRRNADTSTWNLSMRDVLGSSRQHLFGPCARYEIDATLMDIYLVSVFNRAWIIGRPVLYVVVDVFSAMVVGFYLGLEGPSWEGARLALFNAFTDKVEFCRQFGVDITPDQWPCHHLPFDLLGDNGELSGLRADDLPGTLGINPQNAAVQRGDWKPNVEQQFRLTHLEQVDFLPGAIKARERDVRKRKYVLDACLTLPELTAILIRRFIRFNHTSYRADRLPEAMIGENLVDATPLAIWDWGLANMAGTVNIRSRQEIWTNLLPRGTASVRPRGLYFEQRHYSNARIEQEQWFARTRVKRRYEHIEIRHLPYDPSTIWVRNDEAGEWEACQLLDRDEQFRLARREEIWDRVKLLNAAKESKANASREMTARFEADTAAIVDGAQNQASAAREGLSRAQRTRDIKAHRAFEKSGERIERARQAPAEQPPKSPPPSPARSPNVIPIEQGRRPADPLDDIWPISGS